MALYDNTHVPTIEQRQQARDLAISGIPKYMICKIMGLDDDTLNKHYRRELEESQAVAVSMIGKTVYDQALEGDSKAQALYLKTQGAKFGWIEKQVVETVSSEDTQALKEKVKELEGKFERDY